MMRRIFSLFRGGQAAPVAVTDLVLPAWVDEAINCASLIQRTPDDKGAPRVICQFAGRTGFIYREDTASAAIAGMFPELNDSQREQAKRRLQIRVRTHLRDMDMTLPQAVTPWKDRY